MQTKRGRAEIRVVVDYALDAFLECRRTKIHQKAQWKIEQPEVRKDLLLVNSREGGSRLHFDKESPLNEQVRPETFIELHSLVYNRDRLLALDMEALPRQYFFEHHLIYGLQQTRPKLRMDFVPGVNDNTGKFLDVHSPRSRPARTQEGGSILLLFFAASRLRERKNKPAQPATRLPPLNHIKQHSPFQSVSSRLSRIIRRDSHDKIPTFLTYCTPYSLPAGGSILLLFFAASRLRERKN